MKNYTYILLLFFALQTNAQQDSQFTQYMYNPSIYNPAYAGSRAVLSVFAINRTQWVGLDGAPTTNIFSAHLPLDFHNIGAGISIINDKIGPSVENSVSGDVSYTISTSDNFKLAFGLKFTADFWNIDFTKLKAYHQNDNLLNDNVNNQFSSNLGVGIYWYSDKSYFGLSVPKILRAKFYDDNKTNFSQITQHYNIMAGIVLNLNDNFKFKPSTIFKLTNGAPVQIDVSTNFLYADKFSLGLSYKIDAAWSGLAGFQVNKSWFIGYSYDADVSKLINYNSGSHEIFLRYEFSKAYKKVYSPRFF